MRVLRTAGRLLGAFLATVAKTICGMSGAKTFDHDNSTSIYKQREDYRP